MKTQFPRPVVLAIDDDEQTATELSLSSIATVVARQPDDVSVGDLRRANVVLIDYQIDRWPGRDDAPSITLRPAHGVALAAVLRSQSEAPHAATWDTRRAFAIHSAKLHELAGGLPAPSREHVIARTLNLEWAFPKHHNPNHPPLREQVASLAAAVKSLPRTWPEDPEKAVSAVHRLLAVPAKERWRERALDDIAGCHPPVHAWASATKGMAVIRWLLHQVLPYPTFLLDSRYLAARLRVSADSLRSVLSKEKRAQRALLPSTYSGVLAGFLGSRWWRAGVEQLLWEWTEGDPFNPDALHKAVTKHVSKSLQALALSRPVVCVDDAFRPTDHFIEAVDAVEVKPDDWPSFAEQAWLPAATKATERVSALIAPQDRERAGGSGE